MNLYEEHNLGIRYAPWLKDQAFFDVFYVVRLHTLVELNRCYELWSLVRESAKLPEGDILEVGTWRGGSGCLIARQAKVCCPDATVFLCDTFEGVVKAGGNDVFYQGGEHDDTTIKTVIDLADSLDVFNIRILKGMFPEDTGPLIADRKFRLCHIDVDVYQSAKDTLEWVWDRMVVGGIVVYDDFGFDNCPGIVKHVEEESSHPDRLMIYNMNGHAIFIKLR